MKAKPMLCNAAVARAIMDGLQTQDRRPIGNNRVWESDLVMDSETVNGKEASLGFEDAAGRWHKTEERAPHKPGDIIWLREPGRVVDFEYFPLRVDVEYLADRAAETVVMPERLQREDGLAGLPAWASETRGIPNGIFKEAARIFLKVTAVRVERIRDISIEDCVAEGVGGEETPCPVRSDKMHSDAWYDGEGCEACGALSARELFCAMWHELYPGSWERNDWVWVYEFERTEKPAGWPSCS